ncbi:MAG: carbamoyl-phosphate synthase subunit L [Candidatus Leucobacter sulfamidivorax]|nr:carbamoyl-phosphate synthase subunit L [Candidatus Leucobacter sulfamidivorax]
MTRRILISGVGGVVGYGVLRSLRAHCPGFHLIGSDIHEHAVGRAWADEFVHAPSAASAQWPEWLAGLMRSSRVELFIPTLDPELDRFILDPELESRLPAPVALPGCATLEVSQDKWLLHEMLEGDPARIPSSLDVDYARLARLLGSPFLAKPRSGYGSRGICRIGSEAEFAAVRAGFPEQLFAQQIVGNTDAEYTVGVFGDGAGGVAASITLQRWLDPGGTTTRVRSSGEVPEIEAAVTRITRMLRPSGAINMQFRIDHGEARLLEINARISSSSSLRRLFGYNEAAMLVRYQLEGAVPTQPEILHGKAVRYIEDSAVLE